MEENQYSKSFLLLVHVLLGGALGFFTILSTMGYSKNLLLGFTISGLILLVYFFVLKKSAELFTKKSVGAAYFLTISGFISLAFIEMINCSNSITIYLH